MILKEISNRIYFMPYNDRSDRPNLGYIKGENFSVMIDAGNSKEHMELFYKGLKERNLPFPKYALITHWHWDHTFGICGFFGQTIANKLTNHELKKITSWEWTDKAMKERLKSGEEIEFCDTHIRVEYPNLSNIDVTTIDIIFDKTLTLDLGNIHCELSLVGGPHSKDSTLIYIPEEKVLFSGDADSKDYYNNNGKYDKDKLQSFIKLLEKIPFETYLHGHRRLLSKKEIINELKNEFYIL